MSLKDYDIVDTNDHALADLGLIFVTGGLCALFGSCSDTTYTLRNKRDGRIITIDAKNREELEKEIEKIESKE